MSCSSSTATQPNSPYYAWVVNPWIDFLFICGGLVWLCTFAHLLVERVWKIPLEFIVPGLQIVLMYLFNNAHTASTWVRIGHSEANRREFRIHIFTGVVALALAAKGVGDEAFASAMVKLYVLWVVQHYSAQVYGLTLVYLYKCGYPMTVFFKKTLKATFALLAMVSIVGQLTFYHFNIPFFILPLPFWGPLPEWIFWLALVGLCISLGLLAGQIVSIYYNRALPPPLAAALLFGSIFVFLLQRGSLGQVLWLYIPPFFHGSQYVILSGTFHLREIGAADRFARNQAWKAWFTSKGLIYCAIIIVGGAFLYVFSPWFLSKFGIDQNVALGALFATANFHHFLTDRAIWKLRDPKVRNLALV